MSAIFGIIDFEGRPIDPEWIKSMQTDLAHRGPDRQSLYQEESMFMGHMLLQVTPESIYDTSPYEEEGYVITANARLDEREVIMDRLNIPLSEREIITDPLLLLRSFRKFGKDFVKGIYGDFAFAIWDKEKKELFCARDQMGVKPFLYYFQDNRFVFSTETKSIVKLPFVITEIDHINIRNHILFGDYELEKFPWRNINRLRSANTLEVQRSQYVTNKYWHLEYKPNLKFKSEEKASEKLRDLLEIAISDRMRVLGEIGIPLSGGLDSSAIACLAARKQEKEGKKITTASSVLDPNYTEKDIEDELEYIDLVVEQEKNIDPTFIYNSKLSFQNNLNEKFQRQFNQVNYFHYIDDAIYQQFQAKSIRRVLSGLLGDDFVSLNMNPLPYLLLHGRFVMFFKLSYKLKRNLNLSFLSFLRSHILEPFKPLLIRNIISFVKRRRRFWDIARIPLILTAAEKTRLQIKMNKLVKEDYKLKKDIGRYLWPKYWEPFEREDWDCGSSYHQIEMTYPLADRRIVEFMFELPLEHYSAGGFNRGLIRKALFDIIPEKIRDRQNKGPYSPADFQIFQTDILEIKKQLENIALKDKLSCMVDFDKLHNKLELISKSKNSDNLEVDYLSVYRICIWLAYTIWSVDYEQDTN